MMDRKDHGIYASSSSSSSSWKRPAANVGSSYSSLRPVQEGQSYLSDPRDDVGFARPGGYLADGSLQSLYDDQGLCERNDSQSILAGFMDDELANIIQQPLAAPHQEHPDGHPCPGLLDPSQLSPLRQSNSGFSMHPWGPIGRIAAPLDKSLLANHPSLLEYMGVSGHEQAQYITGALPSSIYPLQSTPYGLRHPNRPSHPRWTPRLHALSGPTPLLSTMERATMTAQEGFSSSDEAENTGPETQRPDHTLPFNEGEPQKSMWCGDEKVTPTIEALSTKNVFWHQENWTCYRRNYLSVECAYTLDHHVDKKRLYLECDDGSMPQIQALALTLSASVDSGEGKPIQLIQHTAKRDKGPQLPIRIQRLNPAAKGRSSAGHSTGVSPPVPILPHQFDVDDDDDPAIPAADPTQCQHTFERIQFKSATANNGKRRAQQQYYHLVVALYADVRSSGDAKPNWVKVAHTQSEAIVVRGRSPGHYCSSDNSDRDAGGDRRKGSGSGGAKEGGGKGKGKGKAMPQSSGQQTGQRLINPAMQSSYGNTMRPQQATGYDHSQRSICTSPALSHQPFPSPSGHFRGIDSFSWSASTIAPQYVHQPGPEDFLFTGQAVEGFDGNPLPVGNLRLDSPEIPRASRPARQSVEPGSAPPYTCVQVAHLFAPTPARDTEAMPSYSSYATRPR